MSSFGFFSILLLVSNSLVSYASSGTPTKQRVEQATDIYEFPNDELANERILSLLTIATTHYNHSELKKIIRSVKANPNPALLLAVADQLARVGVHWPLENLAIFYTPELFRQLSPAAQDLVAIFKIKHYRLAHPSCSPSLKEDLQDHKEFFALLQTAIRERDDKAYDTIELLTTIDPLFANEQAFTFLLNTSTSEERIFILGFLADNQLLSASLLGTLQAHTEEDVAHVRAEYEHKNSYQKNDHRLLLTMRNESGSSQLSLAVPNRGRLGMSPDQINRLAKELHEKAEESAFCVSDLLAAKVAKALASKEAFLPEIVTAMRRHDFAYLLPLIVGAHKVIDKEDIVGLVEISARVRDPLFPYMVYGEKYRESPSIFSDHSGEASSYLLALFESENIASELVGVYVDENGNRQDANDVRDWEALVEEARKGIYAFLEDASKFPYNLGDSKVLTKHLKVQIAKKAIKPFDAKQIRAACNSWDDNLRAHGLVPSMHAGGR
jgi:hypothetical protein